MAAPARQRKQHTADIYTLPLITEFPTLGMALTRYLHSVTPRKKGAAQEAGRIRLWLKHPLAEHPLNGLRGVHFSIYRDERLSEGVSGDTVRLELAIISHLYTHAITDWGFEALTNPITRIQMPSPSKGRKRRLQEGEEVVLLTACDEVDKRLKPLVLLALETSMRRSELCSLLWRNVFFDKRYALLEDTKNGEARGIPLLRRTREILEGMKAMATRDSVSELSADQISHLFIEARKKAGIKDLRFHDLRHEATSRLFERGDLSMMEVAAFTGHKSLQMLKRYTHLSAMHIAARLD